jgi:hypothetical protein
MTSPSHHSIIRERQREAAYEEAVARGKVTDAVRDAVKPLRGEHVTDIVSLDADTHIAAVERPGALTRWTVVHRGQTDRIYWPSLDIAVIHAVAVRHGDPSHGVTVEYAMRVLGVPAID